MCLTNISLAKLTAEKLLHHSWPRQETTGQRSGAGPSWSRMKLRLWIFTVYLKNTVVTRATGPDPPGPVDEHRLTAGLSDEC